MLASVAALVLGASDAGAGAGLAIQEPQGGFAVNGVPASIGLTLTPAFSLGPETQLSGCYVIVAKGLPAGLGITQSRVCASSGARSLSFSISGTPRLPISAPLRAATVHISAYAATGNAPSGPALATTTITIPVLPSPEQPTVSVDYANSSLSLVDCPAVEHCWVVGVSTNPDRTNNPPPTGTSPQTVRIQGASAAQHLIVPVGGTFVAELVRTQPLDLRFVRTDIPVSVNAFRCPTVDSCIAVGSYATSGEPTQPFALEMSSDGASWQAHTDRLPQGASGAFSGLDCPVQETCLAVGSYTSETQQTSGFSQALSPGRSPFYGSITLVPSTRSLGAVSCPDSTCFASGVAASEGGATHSGRIVISHDGGNSWAPDQLTTVNPGCSSACTAALQPWYRLVTAEVSFGGLSSMSCARGVDYYCAVAWPFLGQMADTTDGQQWLVGGITQAPYGLGTNVENPVSCPAQGHCFAISSPLVVCGHDYACTHVGVIESMSATYDEPTYGGAEWGLVGFGPPGADDPVLADISCPTVDTCVEVGHWQPHSTSTWSPQFPLVMGTQAAENPYYVPPNLAENNFGAWLSLGFSVISAGIGIAAIVAFPELAPLAFGLGLLGFAGGVTSAIQTGDPYAAVAAVLSLIGLSSIWQVGIGATVAGLGDTAADTGSLPQGAAPLPDWVVNPQVPDAGPADE